MVWENFKIHANGHPAYVAIGLILCSSKMLHFQDQVLSSMQQKLDSLCEQDQNDLLFIKNAQLPSSEAFASGKLKPVGCGCGLCHQHLGLSNDLMVRNLVT